MHTYTISCHVTALIARITDEFRMTLTLNSPHLVDVHLPNMPVLVAGDESRLEQVIQNLLSNVVKYSPAGGLVEVRVTQTPTNAVLEVTDQGIGIPVEALGHLFDAFYRAQNVSGQISGFGLGLHIVHEIVQRHGGGIEVESTEGMGSSFRVVLPLLTLPSKDCSCR